MSLSLPAGERLAAAVLALVSGAGAGLISLAILAHEAYADGPDEYERALVIASAVGLAVVVGSVWFSRRRSVPAADEPAASVEG